jgi:hypothetical protein
MGFSLCFVRNTEQSRSLGTLLLLRYAPFWALFCAFSPFFWLPGSLPRPRALLRSRHLSFQHGEGNLLAVGLGNFWHNAGYRKMLFFTLVLPVRCSQQDVGFFTGFPEVQVTRHN